MRLSAFLRHPALLVCLVAAAGAISCAQGVGGSTTTPISTTPTGDDDNATGDNGDDDDVNQDSGAFGQQDATSGDADDDDAPGREAGADASGDGGDGGHDAGVDGSTAPICPDMVAGTLKIVEIMVESRAGALGNDHGEWVELLNPSATCAVELTGITVSSPRGSGGDVDTASLDDGFKVGPGQTVIVADSLVATDNNGLTGQIYAFNAADVLANGGDTVTVTRNGTALDSLTYTSSSPPWSDGVSAEFPAGCAIKNVDTQSILAGRDEQLRDQHLRHQPLRLLRRHAQRTEYRRGRRASVPMS